MRQVNVQVASGANTATINGIQIDANQLINASFHLLVGDATAAGTFKIQASNDVAPAGGANVAGNFVVTNWVDIPNATVTQAAGTRQALIQLSEISYRWIRAVWVETTPGTSTNQVNMFAVGV